jgi:hypothetical protein
MQCGIAALYTSVLLERSVPHLHCCPLSAAATARPRFSRCSSGLTLLAERRQSPTWLTDAMLCLPSGPHPASRASLSATLLEAACRAQFGHVLHSCGASELAVASCVDRWRCCRRRRHVCRQRSRRWRHCAASRAGADPATAALALVPRQDRQQQWPRVLQVCGVCWCAAVADVAWHCCGSLCSLLDWLDNSKASCEP